MVGMWTFAMTKQNSVVKGLDENKNRSVPVCVTSHDLPVSCPRPGHSVTFLHPKVYLPIKATGKAVCPYCSTRYQLMDN
jgi:uncharacterized Zn-finger protein